MRACMTASGGAMFIPETIARKKCKMSYEALVDDAVEYQDEAETQSKNSLMKKLRKPFFGARKVGKDVSTKVA